MSAEIVSFRKAHEKASELAAPARQNAAIRQEIEGMMDQFRATADRVPLKATEDLKTVLDADNVDIPDLKARLVELSGLPGAAEYSGASGQIVRGLSRMVFEEQRKLAVLTAMEIVETAQTGSTLSQAAMQQWQDMIHSGNLTARQENYNLAHIAFLSTENPAFKAVAAGEVCAQAQHFLHMSPSVRSNIITVMQNVQSYALGAGSAELETAAKTVAQNVRTVMNADKSSWKPS